MIEKLHFICWLTLVFFPVFFVDGRILDHNDNRNLTATCFSVDLRPPPCLRNQRHIDSGTRYDGCCIDCEDKCPVGEGKPIDAPPCDPRGDKACEPCERSHTWNSGFNHLPCDKCKVCADYHRTVRADCVETADTLCSHCVEDYHEIDGVCVRCPADSTHPECLRQSSSSQEKKPILENMTSLENRSDYEYDYGDYDYSAPLIPGYTKFSGEIAFICLVLMVVLLLGCMIYGIIKNKCWRAEESTSLRRANNSLDALIHLLQKKWGHNNQTSAQESYESSKYDENELEMEVSNGDTDRTDNFNSQHVEDTLVQAVTDISTTSSLDGAFIWCTDNFEEHEPSPVPSSNFQVNSDLSVDIPPVCQTKNRRRRPAGPMRSLSEPNEACSLLIDSPTSIQVAQPEPDIGITSCDRVVAPLIQKSYMDDQSLQNLPVTPSNLYPELPGVHDQSAHPGGHSSVLPQDLMIGEHKEACTSEGLPYQQESQGQVAEPSSDETPSDHIVAPYQASHQQTSFGIGTEYPVEVSEQSGPRDNVVDRMTTNTADIPTGQGQQPEKQLEQEEPLLYAGRQSFDETLHHAKDFTRRKHTRLEDLSWVFLQDQVIPRLDADPQYGGKNWQDVGRSMGIAEHHLKASANPAPDTPARTKAVFSYMEEKNIPVINLLEILEKLQLGRVLAELVTNIVQELIPQSVS